MDNDKMSDWGFIYTATGAEYIAEAIGSAQSFKRQMPDIPIALFTDDTSARTNKCFDQCYAIPEPAYGPSDKFYALRRSPFTKTVFLDTDTWCLEQCSELFRLLDRFELGAAHAPVRAMNFVPKGVPRCFPELNTGVIAFQSSQNVLNMLEQWENIYLDYKKRKNINRDQLSFRRALYFSEVNLTILPPEYNLRPLFSYFVGGMAPVKIVHARGGDLKRALKMIAPMNADMGIYPYVVSIEKN